MKTPDILNALQPIVCVFEKLSIPYYVAGSVASSMYGLARATLDIDIVADVKHHNISQLRQFLEKEYYIDEDLIKEAIRDKSSFNLIHLDTAIKIDIFVFKGSSYERTAIERRIKNRLGENVQEPEIYFSSPEDVIIAKLQWYKKGRSISERQWFDVIGVIKVQSDFLNKKYLQNFAKRLSIFKSLKKAFEEAGVKL